MLDLSAWNAAEIRRHRAQGVLGARSRRGGVRAHRRARRRRARVQPGHARARLRRRRRGSTRSSPAGERASAARGRAGRVQGQHEPRGHAHDVLEPDPRRTTRAPTTAPRSRACSTPGVLPLGKCNMDEFAFGSPRARRARSARRRTRGTSSGIPGGSSGGSAAAVSAGHGDRHARLATPAARSASRAR